MANAAIATGFQLEFSSSRAFRKKAAWARRFVCECHKNIRMGVAPPNQLRIFMAYIKSLLKL